MKASLPLAFFLKGSIYENSSQSSLSLLSKSLGVFWSVYAVANGYRVIGGEPSYFLPQAVTFLAGGIVGWAVFGALAKILGRLDALEQQSAGN